MFDDLTALEDAKVGYKTIASACWYTYDLILGGVDRNGYSVGAKSSQSTALHTLYAISTFFMLIHLANMLIAIMGETFSNRREVADQIRIKDHLNFVMDNWHMANMSFEDIDKVKYVITAFNIDEE